MRKKRTALPVAVIGRPNVGKSSLINHILGENRLIVANEAGTTRDAIDTMVENQYGKFIFTDTAGLRKARQGGKRCGALQRRCAAWLLWNAAACALS